MEHLKTRKVFTPKYLLDDSNRFVPSQHDFHHFPRLNGWKLDEQDGYSLDLIEKDQPPKVPISTFLQAWLFFGLIATVVRINRDFFDDDDRGLINKKRLLENHCVNPRAFLSAETSHFVDTSNLEDLLQLWCKTEQKQREAEGGIGIHGQRLRMFTADVALEKARRVVLRYCSYVENTKLGPSYLKVDLEVALTVQLLGEALTNARNNILRLAGEPARPSEMEGRWGVPRWVVHQMEKKKWCIKMQKALRVQLGGNASAFVTIFSLHKGEDDHLTAHHHCDPEDCPVKKAMVKVPYRTRHCDCPDQALCEKLGMLGPDIDKIEGFIKNHKIPLISLEKKRDDLEFGIHERAARPDEKFVTISHVWADGFGNEHTNKLYRCQLAFLAKQLRQVEPESERQGSAEAYFTMPFWMDTLVVPVGEERYKESRKLAIRKIYDVYTKAAYTIVVDNGLMGTDCDENYDATAMRILASGWMRRLWTLQEAYFSQKLRFIFQNDVMDINELDKQFNNENLRHNVASSARAYFDSLMGPERRARLYNQHGERQALVVSVWKAAQWRSTTHKQHETLALATLLNVDYQDTTIAEFGISKKGKGDEPPIGDKNLEEMMRDLWTVLVEFEPRSIPPGIIFAPGEKLSIQGFRWAPKTWMKGHEFDYPDPMNRMIHPAELQPRGLFVRYPGISLLTLRSSDLLGCDPFTFPVDNTLQEWYTVEPADTKKNSRPKGIDSNKQLALILSRPRPRETQEIGLLVEVVKHIRQSLANGRGETQARFVHIISRVLIKRELNPDKIKAKTQLIYNYVKKQGGERESGKGLPVPKYEDAASTGTVVSEQGPSENAVDISEEQSILIGDMLPDDQGWYVDGRGPELPEPQREEPPPSATTNKQTGPEGVPVSVDPILITEPEAETRSISQVPTPTPMLGQVPPSEAENDAAPLLEALQKPISSYMLKSAQFFTRVVNKKIPWKADAESGEKTSGE